MKLARNRLYADADSFFDGEGNAVMYLTPQAAIDVCSNAGERGLAVVRIEGGFWHGPSFEARVDCIWDGTYPPVQDREVVRRNNEEAADFIRGESAVHSAFVISTSRAFGRTR